MIAGLYATSDIITNMEDEKHLITKYCLLPSQFLFIRDELSPGGPFPSQPLCEGERKALHPAGECLPSTTTEHAPRPLYHQSVIGND